MCKELIATERSSDMFKQKLLLSSAVAFLLSPIAVTGVQATTVQPNDSITQHVSEGQKITEYYSFTNHEFFETAKELGYDLEEPINDPNYDPNELNTIQPVTTSFRSGSILDQTTVTLSPEVVNKVKNIGVGAGSLILAAKLPGGWKLAPQIANVIISQVDATRPLQVSLVLQRTANGAQWFATGYQWV